MDSMTQSAQISSSQGLADGQNSAAKESKQSDSFLSSSPVSLIQSPQDKRMVLGSDRPCEGVATSLRFPSKTGSFTPGNYGSEAGPPNEQPDSPIKTSPVSERIKALEALAAQKKQPDFRSDRSFSHFRDHHNEKSLTESSKSPSEKITPTKTTSEVSANQESPQSPFEILGDFRQINDFEETEKWMKAHLPPVPNFDAVDLVKGTLTSDDTASKEEKETDIVIPDVPAAFAVVPDAFMDSPVKVAKQKDAFCDTQRQSSIEEKSEFDLTFLPTAYMWDQHEKSGAEHPTDPNSIPLPPSTAAPTVIGSSPSVLASDGTGPKQDISAEKKPTCSGDIEPPEASEVESSGESEDTVIEDGAPVPSETCDPTVLNDGTTTLDFIAPNLVEVKETPPPKSERKLMQVPTINVIETDEPNYSDEEMELEAEEVKDNEDVKELSTEVPKSPETESEDSENEPTRTRPLETEFIEGYSPPSSPVDSDTDHSPKHKITECLSETVHQESASKPEELFNQNILKDSPSNLFQVQYGNEETSSLIDEKMDFADNDDEWSDEPQDVLVKTCKTDVTPNEATTSTQSEVDEKSNMAVEGLNMKGDIVSRTSFMQDEIYDRQSFDNDYNASSALDGIDGTGQNNAKERFLSGSSQAHVETLIANTAQNEGSEDDQNLGDFISGNEGEPFKKSISRDYPQDPYSYFQSEPVRTINEQDLSKKMSPDSDSENMANENSLPGKRNAAKHQQDSKMAHYVTDTTNTHVADSERSDSFVDFMRECLKSTQDEVVDAPQTEDSPSKNKFALPSSQFPSTMVMDLEQEQLTISALKELGGSQEEEEEMVFLLPKVPGQDDAKPTSLSIKQSPVTSVSHPACSQSNLVLDSSYSKEVEAIDKWVAEAYHLAEHVLTAILTHLSVKDLIHWRDPKKSGIVFGVSMLLLLSLAAFSVISVISYLLLALLCVTITFRIYKSVVQAVQKSSEGHPFKTLIDKDVSIAPETFRKHVDTSLTYINRALKYMTRLFLVEDLVDSLKLAVVMWLLTYVGAVFNGITILILADILLFAVPPIYEKNKTQIDQYIDLVRTQVNTTMAKLQEKLPGAMKRSKTE